MNSRAHNVILNAMNLTRYTQQSWLARDSGFDFTPSHLNSALLVMTPQTNDTHAATILEGMLSVLPPTFCVLRLENPQACHLTAAIVQRAPAQVMILGRALQSTLGFDASDFRQNKNLTYLGMPCFLNHSPLELIEDTSLKREAFNRLKRLKLSLEPT